MKVQGLANMLTNRCNHLILSSETFEEERVLSFFFKAFHTPGTSIIMKTVNGDSTEINVGEWEKGEE